VNGAEIVSVLRASSLTRILMAADATKAFLRHLSIADYQFETGTDTAHLI